MKIVNKEFSLSSSNRNQMIDITGEVTSIAGKSGITNGEVVIYCPHTTAAVTINENADPSVQHDIVFVLEDLIRPGRREYRHSEGNADSHAKSSIIGCSERVVIRDGTLVLGTWQGVFFCEFDGPRHRRVIVQVIGE